MQCPHCAVTIHVTPRGFVLRQNPLDSRLTYARGTETIPGHCWKVNYMQCPACLNFIVWLVEGKLNSIVLSLDPDVEAKEMTEDKIILLYPRTNKRPSCPPEVPAAIAQEYTEACLILYDSPTASAALSRRCLQHFLRDVVKVRPSDLINEIQQVIGSGTLPSHIAEAIDAVRNIGNFAAHPMKSQRTGEILPVEPAEAEWNLEVLEALFDFYCVQPTVAKRKKDALNLKLQEMGKKPMK